MRTTIKTLLVLAAVALLATAATAQNVSFLPATDGDLSATTLAAPLGHKAAVVPREAVAVSFALEADKAIDLVDHPFVATSKEYWVDVTAADLAAGVPVFTHGPGALVRINPAPGEKAVTALDPRTFVLVDPAKRQLGEGAGMELIATADQLKAAGTPFAEGTVAFRLRADLGAGTFTLKAADLGAGRYVMHVLDHASPLALTVSTERSSYLHGQTLVVRVGLAGAKGGTPEGFVASPAGRSWPLQFERGRDGAFEARLVLDAAERPAPGLWEAHIAFQGQADGLALRRYGKVAFAVAMPSARLDGSAERMGGDAGLSVRLGLEMAAAGRYEVRGMLFGSDAQGQLHPIAVGHSAAWLEAGNATLTLGFDQTMIEASGLGAPFEVRDLRLVDQGTMGLLHRQGRGLRIE